MKKDITTGKVLAWTIGVILALIALTILARYTFLREQFDSVAEGLENIAQWEQEYRAQNPTATDAEVDAAFRQGISDMERWKEEYKTNNPGATDADADAALEAGLRSMQQ